MNSSPIIFIGVLFCQAIIVSSLIAGVIAELYLYSGSDFVEKKDGSYIQHFLENYFYYRINWFNLVCGLWFQAFFALDSHVHRNSMQVYTIALLNMTFVGIQAYSFYIIGLARTCYESIPRLILSNTTTFNVSSQCYNSHILGFRVEPVIQLYNNTVSSFQNNSNYLTNAYNLNFALLILMVLCSPAIFYLAWKTNLKYGWTLYKVNGAHRRTRMMLGRYHIFVLTLKLNILLAICIFYGFYATIVENAIFRKWLLQTYFEQDIQDFKSGGYAPYILTCLASLWCIVSAFLFYFIGNQAVRKSNYVMMNVLLLFYLAKIVIDMRLTLYMLNILVSSSGTINQDTNKYFGAMVAIECALDIFIVVMGCWVMYDFKHGVGKLVSDMQDNKPWIFRRKPKHLTVYKERWIID